MEIIVLPDGYNGDTALFNLPPIEYDLPNNVAKLTVHGADWMIRWVALGDLPEKHRKPVNQEEAKCFSLRAY